MSPAPARFGIAVFLGAFLLFQVLVAALLLLAVRAAAWPSPLTPGEEWKPDPPAALDGRLQQPAERPQALSGVRISPR